MHTIDQKMRGKKHTEIMMKKKGEPKSNHRYVEIPMSRPCAGRTTATSIQKSTHK